jgi:hypothetical protein
MLSAYLALPNFPFPIYIPNIKEQNFISSISHSLHRLSIPCYSLVRLLIHHPSDPHFHLSNLIVTLLVLILELQNLTCIAERVCVATCVWVARLPPFLKLTIDALIATYLSRYMSISHKRLLLCHTSIYYGPRNLFDLRLGQAQLNLTKNS